MQGCFVKLHVLVCLLSCYTHHQLLQCPFPMVFVDEQHFFDGILLEAHLIELIKQVQKLLRLSQQNFRIISSTNSNSQNQSLITNGCTMPWNVCVLPLPHSFETSPELPPPGLFHTPAGRDGHRPPDNGGAAGICRNILTQR